MKHLKDIYSTLNEGLSPLLYHFTYSYIVDKIMEENILHATTSLGSSADHKHNSGKNFYFSTQRSKNAALGYGGQPKHPRNACLVLDGVKLKQRYKGKSVNYWGASPDRKDYDSDYSFQHYGVNTNELEDRIIVDSPVISNANKYILEIHIYLMEKDASDLSLKANADKFNIPVYFYNNKNHFANQYKMKAVALETIPTSQKREEENNEYLTDDYYSEENKQLRNTDRLHRNIASLIGLLMLKDEANTVKLNALFPGNELPDRIKSTIERDDYNYYSYGSDSYRSTEFTSSIMNDIHNIKTQTDPLYRTLLSMLDKDIKKFKSSSLAEYISRKMGAAAPVVPKKPTYELRYEDEVISWDRNAWVWFSETDFYELIPKANWYQLPVTTIMNDKEVTMRKLYKFFMNLLGRRWTDKTFKAFELDVVKIIPKQTFEEQYGYKYDF